MPTKDAGHSRSMIPHAMARRHSIAQLLKFRLNRKVRLAIAIRERMDARSVAKVAA